MSFISTIKLQIDSCTTENRAKLWTWYKQCLYEGYAEMAFKVGIKLIPGNTSFYWDSIFLYYFTYIGPANPTLFISLNKLKYMETTNSVGMVSLLLTSSPKSCILAYAKNLCSTWKIPSIKDDSLGEPIDWKVLLEKNLSSCELFQSLYYANLLFNTKKTIAHKSRSAKLYIWQALLEATSSHWLVYQMFSIAMTPLLQWKPITFDMILHCIHLIVTDSLNACEQSETEITNKVRSWVEKLEQVPIKSISDESQKSLDDPFWYQVSQVYLQNEESPTSIEDTTKTKESHDITNTVESNVESNNKMG